MKKVKTYVIPVKNFKTDKEDFSHKPFKKHKRDGLYDVYATSLRKEGDVYFYEIGLGFDVPEGFELVVRPRTSIAFTGMILANSPGTGDSGFTEEYTLAFYHVIKNLPPYQVGDRIAQVRVQPICYNEFHFVDEFEEKTERGGGKFGSTGKK